MFFTYVLFDMFHLIIEWPDLGEAVQVDPIKTKLKLPGTKRLKLKYDELLSTFAFKLNLRRYTWAASTWQHTTW